MLRRRISGVGRGLRVTLPRTREKETVAAGRSKNGNTGDPIPFHIIGESRCQPGSEKCLRRSCSGKKKKDNPITGDWEHQDIGSRETRYPGGRREKWESKAMCVTIRSLEANTKPRSSLFGEERH